MNLENLDELWKRRDEPKALEESLDFVRFVPPEIQAMENFYEFWWRASRVHHFLAMQATQNGDWEEAGGHFGRGAELATLAAQARPDRVEGQFWAGVCLIEAARLDGKLSAFRFLGRATRFLEAAQACDETFHFAGPTRVLGRISHLKPLILGGLLDKAIAFYHRALQIAPGNSTTLLYLAEALIADHQPGEAKRVLKEILNAPRDENWLWEQARDRKKARELSEKM